MATKRNKISSSGIRPGDRAWWIGGPWAAVVPPNGAWQTSVPAVSVGDEHVQVIVNWTQPVDAAPPIVKMDQRFLNPGSGDSSITRTGCP